MSAGYLSNLLIKNQEVFVGEYQSVYTEGLASSPWQHFDHSRGEQGAGERVKDTGIPCALRVSEPIHLCMPRIKIFISRLLHKK
jgi:hypothetical protein